MPILKETIPRVGSNASANYDFRDLAAGIGYEIFYGYVQEFPIGSQYPYTSTAEVSKAILLPNNSIKPRLLASSTTTSLALDFDTSEFNLPRTVKGTAIIYVNCQNIMATQSNCRFLVHLKKVDENGNLTDLTNQYTLDHDSNNPPAVAMSAASSEALFALASTSQAIIKRGEKIRLEVRFSSPENNRTLAVTHDAQSGDRMLAVAIPFRIDQ